MSTRASNNAQRAQSAKIHRYVNGQLDRTRRQVKSTELITHLLVVTIFVVGILQLMALVDAWVWSFNSLARWMCFIFLVVSAVGYLCLMVGPLLLRKIHPDYAAKMIEEIQPNFKNSLLNYVSLRKQPKTTHAAVMDAVTKQAAIDLQTVPEDATVDRSSIVQIGFYLLGLIAFVAFYWMLSPKDPLQSFSRILLPSAKKSAPSIVQVTDVSPGDQEVFFGDPVIVSATIKGQFSPEDVQLMYSTVDGQVIDQIIAMQPQTTSSNRYEATLTTGQGGVQRGLTYKVVARDGASPDYEIVVRPNPSITLKSVEITPPAYTLLPQETISGQGTIEAVEGSLIKVNAAANLPIKLAYLELLVKNPQDSAEFVVVESVSMTANELEAHGEFHAIYNYQAQKQRATHFRLKFLSIEDDANQNANVHALRVIADLAPQIEVLNPIQNSIRLAKNDTLLIDVRASDIDYGISSIELEMQNNGSNLFREQKLPLQSEDGKKRVRGQFQFTPEKYFLRVGETVLFTATASDNRTSFLSGTLDPNQTMSRQYQIEILDSVENPQRPAQPEPSKGDGNQKEKEKEKEKEEEEKLGDQGDQGESEDGDSGESGSSSDGGDTNDKGESSDEDESGSASEAGTEEGEGGAGESGESGAGSAASGEKGDSSMESDPKNGAQENGDSDGDSQSNRDSNGNGTGDGTGDGTDGAATDNAVTEDGGEGGQSESSGEGLNQDDASGKGAQENGSRGNNTQGSESQGSSQDGDAQASGDSNASSEGGAQGNSSSGNEQGASEGAEGDRKPLSDDAADGDVMSRMEEIINEEKAKQGDAAGDNANGQDQKPAQQNTGRGTDPEQENPRQSEGTGSMQKDDYQPPQDAQGGNNNAKRGKGESSSSQGEKNGTAKGSSGNQTGDQSNEGASSEDSNTGQSDETGGSEPGNASADASQDNQQNSGKSGSGDSENSGQSAEQGAKASAEAGEGSGQQKPGGTQPGESGSQGEAGDAGQPPSEAQSGASQGEPGGNGEPGGEGESGGGGEQSAGPSGESASGEGTSGEGESGEGESSEGESSGPQQSSASPSSSSPGKAGGGEGSGPGGETIAEKENTEYSKKATDMILKRLEQERFEPDPDLLEELNWSKEDLNQFLDRWQQMKAAAGTGAPLARQRYEKALKSLGLSSDNRQRKVRGVSDKQEGFNTDSAVNRPPQEIAPGYRAFKRARNRSKN